MSLNPSDAGAKGVKLAVICVNHRETNQSQVSARLCMQNRADSAILSVCYSAL